MSFNNLRVGGIDYAGFHVRQEAVKVSILCHLNDLKSSKRVEDLLQISVP